MQLKNYFKTCDRMVNYRFLSELVTRTVHIGVLNFLEFYNFLERGIPT